MTIFSSKVAEKKADGEIPPLVLVSEYKLLVGDEKAKTDGSVPVANGGIAVAVAVVPHHRHSLFRLCAVLVSLIVLFIVVLGGIMVYKHYLQTQNMYHGFCGVRYRENIDDDSELQPRVASLQQQEYGEFEEEITIDDTEHERIEVPKIGDTRRATVLHDFNKNITAIIDREQSLCFFLPLNRTLVMPPRDFWDLLVKLKTGYYIPNVEVLRENYRALTPPIQDLEPYGHNIRNECRFYDSYKLVRDGEPMMISKRSAEWCKFTGEKWCLGDAGTRRMLCIDIKSCV